MKKLIFLLLLIPLISCNDQRLFDQQVSIAPAGWSYEKVYEFRFNVTNPGVYHDIYVNLRNGEDYKYENMYLLLHMKDTEGRVETRQVNLVLADETGKSKGSGMGDITSYQLPVIKSKVFPKAGEYMIAIEQNMRDTLLQHVMNVGIMVEEGKPVF